MQWRIWTGTCIDILFRFSISFFSFLLFLLLSVERNIYTSFNFLEDVVLYANTYLWKGHTTNYTIQYRKEGKPKRKTPTESNIDFTFHTYTLYFFFFSFFLIVVFFLTSGIVIVVIFLYNALQMQFYSMGD